MAAEQGSAHAWSGEGNIQSRVLDYLQEVEGCTILSPGEPTAAKTGVEIVAECETGSSPSRRLVSVRGWPSATYTQGTRAGQPRGTRPEVLARAWIAQAALDLALSRGADPTTELYLALPATASYVRYLQRLRWFLAAGQIAVYLVAQDGRVSLTPPGTPPVNAFTAPPPDAPVIGRRRKLGLPGASRLQLPVLHALVQAGGSAGRGAVIAAVAGLFPTLAPPPPTEFGQRVSVAQRMLQMQGWSDLEGRGLWRITDAGRAAYAAQWADWLRREGRDRG